MKFLCEQCKAKYQISDDKVVGKTVRMTCRKCGHQIEVRAEVTETSVAKGLPTSDGKGDKPGAPRSPQRPAPPRASSLATSLSSAPRRGTPPQKPGALAGAFQSNVKKEPESALDLMSLSSSSEWYVAINGVPVGPVRASELRRKAAQGSVTDDSLVWQEGMDEWRPVRAVSELAALVREAATSGRPSLITPPPGEGRASFPPPAPGTTTGGGARTSRPSGIPPRPAVRSSEPSAPPPPAAAVARSNVVPFTGPRLATAERLEPEEAEAEQLTEVQVVPAELQAPPERSSLVAPDPFALPKPVTSSGPILPTPPPPAPAASSSPLFTPPPGAPSPFGGPSTSSPALGSPFASASPSLVPAEPQQKKAPPWIPIAMIGAAMTFGLVGGIAYFFRQPTPPPQVVIQMPSATATAAPAPPPPSATEAQPAPSDSVAAAAPEKSGPAPRSGGGKSSGASTAKAVDPSIAALLQGSGSGPSAGPGGSSGGHGGGSSLSSDAIESVVRSHSAGVKRTCWERGGSQQSSVNVTCRVVINGSGQVSSASANGSDPVVSKCIENSVRSWSFPPSGGTTTVDIPFHFVRQ